MIAELYNWINGLPKDLAVSLMGMLPVFELRLAIPVGIVSFHLPPLRTYFLALLGNLAPVIPLLLFFRYFFHRLTGIRFVGSFFRWWFSAVERRSTAVRTWGFWGLVMFVAIPLPVTGAWTGSVAATLVELDTKKAFTAIFLGVMIAGGIVTVLSMVIPEIVRQWSIFI